jgi:hypothetical protein
VARLAHLVQVHLVVGAVIGIDLLLPGLDLDVKGYIIEGFSKCELQKERRREREIVCIKD